MTLAETASYQDDEQNINFDPFFCFLKWQNNPKYDNLSRNFYIYLTASGEGGSTQVVSLTAFSQFFLTPSLMMFLDFRLKQNSVKNAKKQVPKTEGNLCVSMFFLKD